MESAVHMLGFHQAYAKALKNGRAYEDVQRKHGNSLIMLDLMITLASSDRRMTKLTCLVDVNDCSA